MEQRLSLVTLGVADLARARAFDSTTLDSGGWGGDSGVFLDPGGHPWEVAHDPHWTLEPDGAVRL